MTDAINGVLVTMINFLFGPIMLCVLWGRHHDDHSTAGGSVPQIWDGIP